MVCQGVYGFVCGGAGDFWVFFRVGRVIVCAVRVNGYWGLLFVWVCPVYRSGASVSTASQWPGYAFVLIVVPILGPSWTISVSVGSPAHSLSGVVFTLVIPFRLAGFSVSSVFPSVWSIPVPPGLGLLGLGSLLIPRSLGVLGS